MKSPLNRTKILRLRVTPAEKALVEERARTAGLTASEFVRREAGIGHFGTTDLREAARGTAGHQEGSSDLGTAGLQEAPLRRRDRASAAAKAREALSSV